MIPKKTSLILLMLAAALAGCNLATDPVPAGPVQSSLDAQPIEDAVPAARPDPAAGEAIYLENCAACHGPNGQGGGELAEQVAEQGGNIPNIADFDRVQGRDPQTWYQITTNGNIGNLMPPWQQALTDAERWDVTYYMYSFARPDDALEVGRALYAQRFAAEYGPDGGLAGLNDPAQMAPLSLAAIREQFVTDEDLSEEQAWAVAWYIQSLSTGGTAEPEAETAPGVLPEATGDGVVRGEVINASGGPAPTGVTVRLSGARLTEEGQIEEFLVREEPLMPDASFAFEAVPFDLEEAAYTVSLVYDGVLFNNGALVDPAQPALELPLVIYENTTDPDALVIETLSLAVRQEAASLRVVQIMEVRSTTESVYVTEEPVVGGRRGSFGLRLPLDAFGVRFEGGELGSRFILTDRSNNTVYDTRLLPPDGDPRTIIVSYSLPFEQARDVALSMLHDVESVVILAEEGLRTSAPGLAETGSDVVGGVPYVQYRLSDLTRGETLVLSLSTGGAGLAALSTALGALLVVLVVAGVVYTLLFGRRTTPEGELSRDLLVRVAELDRQFESGQMDRFTYEVRRAELKAELAEMD
ncbi:MAG: c-type cytochrome [Chloroflexi bacterium]|nr:c-type cytochrome [Chloroflexota bacterium]